MRHHFASALRQRIWTPLQHKGAFLLCIPYAILVLSDCPPLKGLWLISLSLLTIVGIIGIAYFFNDLSDLSTDEKLGKANMLLPLNNFLRVLLLSFFIMAALLPWVFLPWNVYSTALLCLELLLFIVYALPPFRWKEIGWLGVLSDALYAHLLPGVLAAYTFVLATNKPGNASLLTCILLCTALLLTGIRNILKHQCADEANDLQSKTQTIATRYGNQQVKLWMKQYLCPVELMAWMLLFVSLPRPLHGLAFIWPLYMVYVYFRELMFVRKALYSPQGFDRSEYDFIGNAVLNEFFEKWMPIILLLMLAYSKPLYFLLLAVHLLIFFSNTYKFRHDISFIFSRVQFAFILLFGHFIYYKILMRIKHEVYWKMYHPLILKKKDDA